MRLAEPSATGLRRLLDGQLDYPIGVKPGSGTSQCCREAGLSCV